MLACKADGSLCQVAGGLLQYATFKPFSTNAPKNLRADLKPSGPELLFGISDKRLPSMCRDGPILGLAGVLEDNLDFERAADEGKCNFTKGYLLISVEFFYSF